MKATSLPPAPLVIVAGGRRPEAGRTYYFCRCCLCGSCFFCYASGRQKASNTFVFLCFV